MSPTDDTGHAFVAAVCVLIERNGAVLALQRAAGVEAAPGVWEALSGRIEPDEEPLAAAGREVAEECGLEVRIDPRPFTAYAARRRGAPMVVIVYRATHLSGEVVLSDEHDDFAWVDADGFAARSSIQKLANVVRTALRPGHADA